MGLRRRAVSAGARPTVQPVVTAVPTVPGQTPSSSRPFRTAASVLALLMPSRAAISLAILAASLSLTCQLDEDGAPSVSRRPRSAWMACQVAMWALRLSSEQRVS